MEWRKRQGEIQRWYQGGLLLLLQMSFNYPVFLWALAFLAIPVIIHLFNFRRTTRIFFSNVRFLKQIKQETTQKRKLKQYLILASRLLFLFFLVMVFAQPFLPAGEQLGSQREITIYLDNSFSMSAPVEEKVRALDAGAGFVREILNLFPPETRFKLITNDFAPFSNSYKSASEINDLLSQVRLSPVSRSFEEIAKRMDGKGSTAFWISDFQRSTFGQEFVMDSSWQVRLVPIACQRLSNVYVDSVSLENPFVIGGERNTLKVRLRNDGSRLIEGLIMRLTVNGIQSATTSVTLQPNSFAETSFDLSGTGQGYNEAVLSFSDFPISFDNEFYFALNYSGRLRIIEIKKDNRITYVERVYGNKQLFDFRSYAVANLEYSLLDEADLVVINGIDRIESSLGVALQNYRINNGSLLLIPGMQPNIDSYRNLVNVSGLSLQEKAEWSELDRPDFQNPFYENVFEERTTALAMPHAKKILDWGADRSALLRFKDGRPYLSKMGGAYLLASPLEKDDTDLYNHALFVPIMYRIAASGKRIERKPYFYLSSTLISVPADSLQGEEPARLIGAQELIPSQRRLGDRLQLEVPRFVVSPGFYRVVHQRDTLDLIAFNTDKRESMLDQMSGEEVKAALGGGDRISIFKSTSAQAFSSEIKERYLGTPLWKYALILALIFLLAEVLLIRFLK
jgi:hypothetical protein